MLDNGASLEDTEQQGGTTLLAVAVLFADFLNGLCDPEAGLELVSKFLEMGASIYAENDQGKSVLQGALLTMHPPIINLILKYGVKPNQKVDASGKVLPGLKRVNNQPEQTFKAMQKLTRTSTSEGDNLVYTLLLYLAENELFDYFDTIIRQGAIVDTQTSEGATALALTFVSLKEERYVMVEKLISYGSNPYLSPCANGFNLLHICVMEKDLRMLEILGKYKPKHNNLSGRGIEAKSDEQGFTPLHLTIAQDWFDGFNCLAQLGINTNVRNKAGDSPLLTAIKMKTLTHKFRVIELLLLARGASVDTEDSEGLTSFHWAIELYRETSGVDKDLFKDTVLLLLQHEPNLDPPTPNHISPLVVAAMCPGLDGTAMVRATLGNRRFRRFSSQKNYQEALLLAAKMARVENVKTAIFPIDYLRYEEAEDLGLFKLRGPITIQFKSLHSDDIWHVNSDDIRKSFRR